MQVRSYQSIADLDEVEAAWNRLGDDGLFFVPSFSELKGRLGAQRPKFRIVVAKEHSDIQAIACFIYRNSQKFYHIGGKKLFCLPARVVTLYGSCVIGRADEGVIQDLFQIILKDGDFDLIDVGHIFVDSALYKAISTMRGAFAWRSGRKRHHWWLIRLPSTFNEYIESLRESTRKNIARDGRRFSRRYPEFKVLHRLEDVDLFLRDAVTISRLTYQWKLGYSLRNDPDTREHFRRLATQGMFRGYISYIDGKPCAYGWGDLAHGKFYFRQTGYDPVFKTLSPGTALITNIIKDMIENTDCRVFHFQWGGEDGYKSRLATESHLCMSMQIAALRPYPILIVCIDYILNFAKNFVGLFVERGPLKPRLRRTLRHHGIGTF